MYAEANRPKKRPPFFVSAKFMEILNDRIKKMRENQGKNDERSVATATKSE